MSKARIAAAAAAADAAGLEINAALEGTLASFSCETGQLTKRCAMPWNERTEAQRIHNCKHKMGDSKCSAMYVYSMYIRYMPRSNCKCLRRPAGGGSSDSRIGVSVSGRVCPGRCALPLSAPSRDSIAQAAAA